MRFTVILMSLGVVTWASVGQAADKPAASSDQDRLQAWWAYYTQPLDAEPTPKLSYVSPLYISGNKVEFVQKGAKSKNSLLNVFFTMDPTQDPKTIDFHWLDYNKKTNSWKGIYTLENNEAKVQ